MSGSVNRVVLVGRVGKDPDVKTFPDGGRIVNFSLATGKKWRDRASGERKESTTWHNISVRDTRMGDVAEKYIRKGSQVYLEGEISNRSYKKDGITRYITEIQIAPFTGKIELLSAPAQAPREERQPTGTDQKGNPKWEGGDDKIPF